MEFCPKCNTLFQIVDDAEIKVKKEQVAGDTNDLILNKLYHLPDITHLIKNIDINTVMKSHEYNILSNKEQNYILNKVQDTLEFSEKKISKIKPKIVEFHIYYLCTNCLYYKSLVPGTQIFNKSYKAKGHTKIKNYSHMISNPVLPRTKEYTCVNQKCQTHKKPELKEAIFITDKAKQLLVYVCVICKVQWT